MKIIFQYTWENMHGNDQNLLDLVRIELNQSWKAIQVYQQLKLMCIPNYTISIEVSKEYLARFTNMSIKEVEEGIEKLTQKKFLIKEDEDSYFFFDFPPLPEAAIEPATDKSFYLNPKAIWFPGYENLYAVTKNGMIYSFYTRRFLIPQQKEDGAKYVSLSKDGEQIEFTLTEIREKINKEDFE